MMRTARLAKSQNLSSLSNCNFKVDYILTHTAPRQVVEEMCSNIIPGEEELQGYLQEIAEKSTFQKWYFGHWHMDIQLMNKYHGLMDEIVRIDEDER